MMEYVLKPQTQKWIASVISELEVTDDKLSWKQITVTKYSDSRSTQMNRYFHALRDAAADHWGFDREAMGEYLKRRFIGTDIVEVGGVAKEVTRRSSKLNVKEFGDFLDQICAFLLEQGFVPPAPPYQTYER